MNTMTLLIVATPFFLVAGDVARDPAADDLGKLQGAWLTISLIDEGKTLVDEHAPPKPGPVTKVAYAGDKWFVKVDDKTVATGTIRLDASKTPKELDVMDETGTRNEKTKLAIYELDGQTFRYCIARAGQPRPTEFTSMPGSGHSLIVSRREQVR